MTLEEFEKLWNREIYSKNWNGEGIDFGRQNEINKMVPKLIKLAKEAKFYRRISSTANQIHLFRIIDEVFGDEA